MRRAVGLVLLGLGVFLLVLAPVLKFYAYPKLALIPQDQNSGTVATGTGTYYDPANGAVPDANLIASRNVRGDVPAAVKEGADTAVWNVFVRVERVEDSHLITASTDRVAMDRRSAMAKDCCGSEPTRKGLTYTFPIGTEKKTYPYYDISVDKDFPAKYVGTDTLKGLSVYHFRIDIAPQQIGEPRTVPGSLVGEPDKATTQAVIYYSNIRDIWVEPTSGVIVKGQEKLLQTFRTDGDEDKATLLDSTLTFTDKTQTQQAKTASDSRGQINILNVYGPLLGLLLGIVLVLAGLVILRAATPPTAGRRRASADSGQLQPA